MSISMIEATCHCGASRATATEMPQFLLDCNCSLCRRYKPLWAYYEGSQVEIESEARLLIYVWGEKRINFHFCPDCHCLLHNSSEAKEGQKRIGINARMATPESVNTIRVRKFDGADSWEFVD